MAKRSRQQDELRKAIAEEFLYIARVSVQTVVQAIVGRKRMFPIKPAAAVELSASLLTDALAVAKLIPDGMSASEAARDFGAYVTDPGRHWDDPLERLIPAKWMGLEENTILHGYLTEVFEIVDDRWQIPNPEWDDLPYDRSATLRLLVHLREHAVANRKDLEEVLRPFGGGDVEDALREPIEEGWVDRVEGEGGPIWSGTGRLRPDRLVVTRIEEPPAPRRDIAAERRRDRQLRLARLSDKPDARTLLLEVRRQKQLKSHELQPLVPHLDRNAMVRLLKQLRNAGWLEVVGTTKNAQWRATEKLANADFRKPAPLPDL